MADRGLLGVMLSLLHQSSLGAIYLILLNKMSPLWYNPLLPYFFLVSTVAMGLSMVIWNWNHPSTF